MKKILTILITLLCTFVILAGCATYENTDASGANIQVIEEKGTEAAVVQESEQAQSPSAVLIEPEQLISLEKAEALLGEPLTGEKTEQSVVGQKIMFYEAVDENSDQYLQIGLTQQAFMPEGSPNTPESLYQAICDAFEAEPVSGLGDEAQIIPSGYQIMCDGYYLTVSAGYTNDDDGIMSEASQTAVANLKALLGK